MPDLIITDDLVYRCAEAALNAGRRPLDPMPPARLADLSARSREQWVTEARAVLVEALRSVP